MWRDYALLLLISFFAFWFLLGKIGLIDPDEPFYAMTAREMVESGDWLTPQIFGKPQFEKPIFYYWLAAGSFAIFGESEFTGRLPTAIAATVMVLLTYWIGRRLFNRQTGFIAGLYMATGLELCIMGRLMLTDIPMTIFVSASLFCYWLALEEPNKRDKWIFWHLVFAGLAVLTKGPIGSLATLMATISFTIFAKKPFLLRPSKGLWWGLLAYAIIVVPWYTLMIVKYKWAFVDEFFIRDNFLRFIRAEHPANNNPWYYPGVFFVGSIPWLPGFVLAVRDLFQNVRTDLPRLFVKTWFLSNFLFLTAAASKLPSYGFYLFVPAALMIAYGVNRLITQGFRSNGEKWTLIGAAALQAVAAVVAPFVEIVAQFKGAVWLFAVGLFVVLIALWMQKWRLWLGATAVSAILFVVGALTLSYQPAEEMLSIRPITEHIKEVRKPGEPLMAGKFAIRGVWFYLKEPVTVIAQNERPFWADHPLEIIPGKKQLEKYLRAHNDSALVVMRPPEWDKYHNFKAFQQTEPHRWYGKNLFIRGQLEPKKPKAPKTQATPDAPAAPAAPAMEAPEATEAP